MAEEVNENAKSKAIQAVCRIISVSNWVTMAAFCLVKTFAVSLVISALHITV